MTRGVDFIKKGRCKNKHCSSMSNNAFCDLNSKVNVLNLHDNCHNPKSNCQKIVTSTPHQYILESGSSKSKLKSNFRGTKTVWDKFLKPALKMAGPYIGKAVSAKTKNPKIGQATANILKRISGGKILSLTDLHGNGLCLKVV